MKKKKWLSDGSRLFMLSLISGLLFSSTGFAQKKDCACIKKIKNGPVITFLNVSEYAETNPNYVMLTDCEDGPQCEGPCTWAYNEGVHGWKIEHGECMEWPAVQPADGKSNNPYMRTEIIRADTDVFQFYPNPATDQIEIKTTAESERVTTIIYDITGSEVMRSTERLIEVGALSAGTYIIGMSDGVYLQREHLIIE